MKLSTKPSTKPSTVRLTRALGTSDTTATLTSEGIVPRDPQYLLFVGIRNQVVALDDRTGTEVWRTALVAADFVTVQWDGQALYAANSGEVFRLDPRDGAILWNNKLKGLGRGLVTLASSRSPNVATQTDSAMVKKRRDEQAAAAAM
jgi:outer membrane protein assembly factor BamB